MINRLFILLVVVIVVSSCTSTYKQHKKREANYYNSLSINSLCKIWQRDKGSKTSDAIERSGSSTDDCKEDEPKNVTITETHSMTEVKESSSFGFLDLLILAAAMPSSGDSLRTRNAKTAFIKGYLPNNQEEYDENCGCPYDTASDQTRCGTRSAWSKPDGATPNCISELITIKDYKDKDILRRQ